MNSSLTHLDISGNNIEAIGGAAIADCLKVATAVVECEFSQSNSTLVTLDISGNLLGNRGVAAILQALRVMLLLLL